MASITPVLKNYKSLNTDLSGRQQIRTPAGSLAQVMKDLHLIYVPTGSIFPYAGSAAPAEFLLCDGSAVSRVVYATLFNLIGTTYGSGDGVTTFNLPNFKGRIPVGRDAAQTEFDALGETGGAKTHTLTIPEMPTHLHTITDPGHLHSITDKQHNHVLNDPTHSHSLNFGSAALTGVGPSDDVTQGSGFSTNSASTGITIDPALTGIDSTNLASTGITQTNNTGGSLPHNNLQPYLVVNYIIKI